MRMVSPGATRYCFPPVLMTAYIIPPGAKDKLQLYGSMGRASTRVFEANLNTTRCRSNGDRVTFRLREQLRKPEGMGRWAVHLIVLQTGAPLCNGWDTPHGNPPEAIVRLIHLFEPLGPIFQDVSVLRAIDVIAQVFDGVPNGHVHDNERVVVVSDIGRVAGLGL